MTAISKVCVLPVAAASCTQAGPGPYRSLPACISNALTALAGWCMRSICLPLSLSSSRTAWIKSIMGLVRTKVSSWSSADKLYIPAGVNEERPHRVVSRLKQMLLDAEAKNSKAAADARIAQAEAGALGTKVR